MKTPFTPRDWFGISSLFAVMYGIAALSIVRKIQTPTHNVAFLILASIALIAGIIAGVTGLRLAIDHKAKLVAWHAGLDESYRMSLACCGIGIVLTALGRLMIIVDPTGYVPWTMWGTGIMLLVVSLPFAAVPAWTHFKRSKKFRRGVTLSEFRTAIYNLQTKDTDRYRWLRVVYTVSVAALAVAVMAWIASREHLTVFLILAVGAISLLAAGVTMLVVTMADHVLDYIHEVLQEATMILEELN